MEVEFDDDNLAALERGEGGGRWGTAVVRGFQKVLRIIRAAVDERDFRAMRSLNFEKLQGDRLGQWSFRLNDQWRLIVRIRAGKPKNTVIVVEITDYH